MKASYKLRWRRYLRMKLDGYTDSDIKSYLRGETPAFTTLPIYNGPETPDVEYS